MPPYVNHAAVLKQMGEEELSSEETERPEPAQS